MNILILSWNFPPVRGGIEYVLHNLFRGLRANDYVVRVVTARAEVSETDNDVYRVTKRGVIAYLCASLFKSLSLCRQSRPDVVVCGTLLSAPIAWILSKVYGVPSLVLVHGTDILRGGNWYRRTACWFLRRSTRLAANSENTKRLLLAVNMSERQVDVIPPGVDIDAHTCGNALNSTEMAELTRGRAVLLIVGRLIRRKGVYEFVKHVMPELVRHVPELLLLVVGDDPKESLAHKHEALKDIIDKEVRATGLQDHVRLLGNVSDDQLHDLYMRSQLFVLPCLDIPGDVEGFGIVFLEAALQGTPAVSTKVGGIPEAIEDGSTGMLVDPGDYPALIKTIRELLTDEDRRRELGRCAAQRARDHFAWPIIISKYEAALRQCIVDSSQTHSKESPVRSPHSKNDHS